MNPGSVQADCPQVAIYNGIAAFILNRKIPGCIIRGSGLISMQRGPPRLNLPLAVIPALNGYTPKPQDSGVSAPLFIVHKNTPRKPKTSHRNQEEENNSDSRISGNHELRRLNLHHNLIVNATQSFGDGRFCGVTPEIHSGNIDNLPFFIYKQLQTLPREGQNSSTRRKTYTKATNA